MNLLPSSSPNRAAASTYDRQKVLFTRGKDVYLWIRRVKYLDFLSGLGVNALGHGHQAIQAVLKKQAES